MSNIVMILSRVIWIIFSVILSVLIWKTAEYFNSLSEKDKHKPLLAWNTLMMFIMLISYVLRLIKG